MDTAATLSSVYCFSLDDDLRYRTIHAATTAAGRAWHCCISVLHFISCLLFVSFLSSAAESEVAPSPSYVLGYYSFKISGGLTECLVVSCRVHQGMGTKLGKEKPPQPQEKKPPAKKIPPKPETAAEIVPQSSEPKANTAVVEVGVVNPKPKAALTQCSTESSDGNGSTAPVAVTQPQSQKIDDYSHFNQKLAIEDFDLLKVNLFHSTPLNMHFVLNRILLWYTRRRS